MTELTPFMTETWLHCRGSFVQNSLPRKPARAERRAIDPVGPSPYVSTFFSSVFHCHATRTSRTFAINNKMLIEISCDFWVPVIEKVNPEQHWRGEMEGCT
jgi:hypothetical protein